MRVTKAQLQNEIEKLRKALECSRNDSEFLIKNSARLRQDRDVILGNLDKLRNETRRVLDQQNAEFVKILDTMTEAHYAEVDRLTHRGELVAAQARALAMTDSFRYVADLLADRSK